MIYGISYDKLFNELEERGFTQYSLVNLKRDTSDYEQYYGKDNEHVRGEMLIDDIQNPTDNRCHD